jgi:prepilin-type N-terminal cleavage/methylation domain-containing protein
MRKKSFTLMEVLTVLIIIGILATLGVPAILNTIEESRARVCEENLKALKAALDIYAMENDQMPAGISKLPNEYIRRGYAKVISSRDKKFAWKVKIGEFFERLEHKNLAYAGNPKPYLNLKEDLAKGNLNMISCPLDKTSPVSSAGGISYGLRSGLVNMTNKEYRDILTLGSPTYDPNYLLIGDCDNATFSNAGELSAYRHKRGDYFGLVITRGGTIGVVAHGGEYFPNDTTGNYKKYHPWQ